MSWESWEDTARRGPEALAFKGCGCLIFVGVPILVILALVFGGLSCVGRVADDATKVMHAEFNASALLKKYQWFKDAAAALDAKLATIKVYERRFASLKEQYVGNTRGEWSREDREQSNLWESEVAGVKASYNRLAAEYNAAMAKENWRFANAGNVPAGGKPLPREFREYEEK